LYLNALDTEKIHDPPGVQLEISSKEAWKKHTFFGQKHALFGRQVGGWRVLRALTKKIYPVLFLKYLGPLSWYYSALKHKIFKILFGSGPNGVGNPYSREWSCA